MHSLMADDTTFNSLKLKYHLLSTESCGKSCGKSRRRVEFEYGEEDNKSVEGLKERGVEVDNPDETCEGRSVWREGKRRKSKTEVKCKKQLTAT